MLTKVPVPKREIIRCEYIYQIIEAIIGIIMMVISRLVFFEYKLVLSLSEYSCGGVGILFNDAGVLSKYNLCDNYFILGKAGLYLVAIPCYLASSIFYLISIWVLAKHGTQFYMMTAYTLSYFISVDSRET